MAELMQGDIVNCKDQWGNDRKGCIVVDVSVELLPPHALCEVYSPNFHDAFIVQKDTVIVTNHPERYEDRKNNVLYANQHYLEYLERNNPKVYTVYIEANDMRNAFWKWQMFEDKLAKLWN